MLEKETFHLNSNLLLKMSCKSQGYFKPRTDDNLNINSKIENILIKLLIKTKFIKKYNSGKLYLFANN